MTPLNSLVQLHKKSLSEVFVSISILDVQFCFLWHTDYCKPFFFHFPDIVTYSTQCNGFDFEQKYKTPNGLDLSMIVFTG